MTIIYDFLNYKLVLALEKQPDNKQQSKFIINMIKK